MSRIRLDVLLTERGLAESREKAQALIMAGRVVVAGAPGLKPGQRVAPDVRIELRAVEPYVSRGGHKLAYALDQFGLSIDGLVVVDVGASTGGFTDVLLQRGARRVFAVDVGRGQLHNRLAADPRVVALERTNARYLESLPEQPDLATFDVSFISLRLVIPPVYRLLKPGSSMIALVKPQFEAGRGQVERGGVVRSPTVHRRVLLDFTAWLSSVPLSLGGLVPSPLRGPAGNVEFLALLRPPTAREQAPAEMLIEEAMKRLDETQARGPDVE